MNVINLSHKESYEELCSRLKKIPDDIVKQLMIYLFHDELSMTLRELEVHQMEALLFRFTANKPSPDPVTEHGRQQFLLFIRHMILAAEHYQSARSSYTPSDITNN